MIVFHGPAVTLPARHARGPGSNPVAVVIGIKSAVCFESKEVSKIVNMADFRGEIAGKNGQNRPPSVVGGPGNFFNLIFR